MAKRTEIVLWYIFGDDDIEAQFSFFTDSLITIETEDPGRLGKNVIHIYMKPLSETK